MIWARRLLLVVIALELGGVAWWIRHRRAQAAPPLPSLRWVEPTAAKQVQFFQDNLQQDVSDAGRWLQLAEAYQAVGLLPQSEACFRRVTQLQSESADAAFAWGRSLEPLGRTTEAITAFQRALDLEHSEPDRCWHHIGLCHLREESADKAEDAFAKVKAYPPSRYELAKIYFRTDRAELAIPILDQLIADFPNALEPYQLRARAAEQAGDQQAAQRLHEQAEWANKLKDMEPKCIRPEIMAVCDAEQVRNRVFELLESQRFDEAADALKRQLEFQWNTQMLYTLVDLRFQQRDLGDVAELLQTQMLREGPAMDTLDRLGDYHAMNNQLSEARAAWERALRLRNSAGVHAKLAQLFQQQGDPQAQRHRAQSLEASGVEAFRHGQLPAAQQLFEEAAKLDENLPNAWFYLGEIYRLVKNDQEQAVKAYQRCLELDPTHGRAHARLGNVDP